MTLLSCPLEGEPRAAARCSQSHSEARGWHRRGGCGGCGSPESHSCQSYGWRVHFLAGLIPGSPDLVPAGVLVLIEPGNKHT